MRCDVTNSSFYISDKLFVVFLTKKNGRRIELNKKLTKNVSDECDILHLMNKLI